MLRHSKLSHLAGYSGVPTETTVDTEWREDAMPVSPLDAMKLKRMVGTAVPKDVSKNGEQGNEPTVSLSPSPGSGRAYQVCVSIAHMRRLSPALPSGHCHFGWKKKGIHYYNPLNFKPLTRQWWQNRKTHSTPSAWAVRKAQNAILEKNAADQRKQVIRQQILILRKELEDQLGTNLDHAVHMSRMYEWKQALWGRLPSGR